MTIDVMIDIETLDTSRQSAVYQIAACYTSSSGEVVTFNKYLNWKGQLLNGRKISKDTLKFHIEKNSDNFLNMLSENWEDNYGALSSLCNFINSIEGDFKVWANSPSFDIIILEDLLRNYGFDGLPDRVKFYTILDFRTIKSLFSKEDYNEIRKQALREIPFEVKEGDLHNAEIDSILQMIELDIMKKKLLEK